jgi:hypothetical protein
MSIFASEGSTDFDLRAPQSVATSLLAAEPGFQGLGRSIFCWMNFNPLATTLAHPPPFTDQGWVSEEQWLDAQDVKARNILRWITAFQDEHIELFRHEPSVAIRELEV